MKKIASLALLAYLTPLLVAQKERPQLSQTPALNPQEVTFSQLTGDGLVRFCKGVDADENSSGSLMCEFYLTGFGDGFGMAMLKFNKEKQSQFCIPEEVTKPILAKVIVKFGADHPNYLALPSGLFTAMALKDAFPCRE
jgi:hypothetical protein